MKRLAILFSAVALAFGAQGASAQETDGPVREKRHEFNLFVGFFGADLTMSAASSSYDRPELSVLYEPHVQNSVTPVITLGYNYKLLGFLKLGGQISYAGYYRTTTYLIDGRVTRGERVDNLYALPEVKFCIPSAEHFRLYAKLAAGARFRLQGGKEPVAFAWDITPIGFEWAGKTVYGNCEFCWGNVVKGARLGIGYRF